MITALFTGCDREDEQPLAESPPLDYEAEANFAIALPEVYEAAGDTYREDLFYYQQDIESGVLAPVQELNTFYVGFDDDIQASLYGYTKLGLVSTTDIQKVYDFNEAISTLGLTSDLTLTEGREKIERWMGNNGVTVEDFPLAYHSILIATESLFENQITKLQKEQVGIGLKGADNNTLCTVSGFLCSQTNAFVSKAAQTALVLGVKKLLSTQTNWTSGQINVASAGISLILSTFWDNIFCNEDCDNCGNAAGIRAVYNGCNFTGIQAVGNFEFAEEWSFLIDNNQDGAYENNVRTFTGNGFIAKSALPTTPFKTIVDVQCDGGRSGAEGSSMPWPTSRQAAVYVDPSLSVGPPRPTANFTAPPKKGTPYPYYYDANTQLCFGMTNLALRGWTFVRWETTTGGSPRTGTSSSNFCTSFPAPPRPTTASVNAIFSHPCSPTNYVLSVVGSVVICATGDCN